MSKIFRGTPVEPVCGEICFGPFALGRELRRSGMPLAITPKALAVLRLLVQSAGELVTKHEIWEKVWSQVIVTDSALTMCMAEVRRVLGDDARHPTYIATVAKRGYRFIHPVVPGGAGSTPLQPTRDAPTLLGRSPQLEALRRAVSGTVDSGTRLVLVIGEPGIGKSTLLLAFKAMLARDADMLVVSGQCYEHFGPTEPYLPLLEGLSEVCRTDAGDAVRASLEQHAPLWLTQLPSLIALDDAKRLGQRIFGATPERMQRELIDALEALAMQMPVVLCLEDIHWSDQATLDWLNRLTRRRWASRVYVIATVRDAQAVRGRATLRDFLRGVEALPQCLAVELARLPASAVLEHLQGCLVPSAIQSNPELVTALAQLLHSRTGGNPLFLTNVVREILGNGPVPLGVSEIEAARVKLQEGALPDSLLQLINMQLEQLPREELWLLEAGSVAGESFTAAVLAEALSCTESECETRCAVLARETRLIEQVGLSEWPDGTVATRYVFRHSLYREALYARLPAGQVAHLHRAIGRRLESAHGVRSVAIAGELAMHFAKGRLRGPSSNYYLLAGRNALDRAAYGEAEEHFLRGLEQLAGDKLKPLEDFRQTEVSLQMALGQTLIAIRGWASALAEQAFAKAYHLSSDRDLRERFMPLWGMAMVSVVRADFTRYGTLGHELLRHAEASGNDLQLACARWVVGQRLFHIGDFKGSIEAFESALAGFKAIDDIDQVSALGAHFGMFTLSYLSHAHWCVGQSERAMKASAMARSLADEVKHAYSTSIVYAYAAFLGLLMRDAERALCDSSEVMALSREQGFEYYLGWGLYVRGWADDSAEFVDTASEDMTRGLALMEATGAALRRPYYFALLAERHSKQGRGEAADQAMQEALDGFARTHERCWEAELYRIQGVIAEASTGGVDRAERHYRQALSAARRQGALSFELRAALSLAHLLVKTWRAREAREMLENVSALFTSSGGGPMWHDEQALAHLIAVCRAQGDA